MEVYGLNFRERVGLREEKEPDVMTVEFDPKWLYERIEGKLPENGVSNANWKVHPKFDENYQREIEEFSEVWGKVKRR